MKVVNLKELNVVDMDSTVLTNVGCLYVILNIPNTMKKFDRKYHPLR